MTVTHVEWEIGVAVIDTIKLLSSHELHDIVFDNWVLSSSGDVGSCDVSSDGITPGEDVLESFVLKSILIDINESV